MNASDLLEAYAAEEIGNNTKIIYQSTTGAIPVKIVSSDITDIDLKTNRGDAKTVTMKDIVKLFLDDTIVGSTEIGLCKDDEEVRELEIVSISEEVIIFTTL